MERIVQNIWRIFFILLVYDVAMRLIWFKQGKGQLLKKERRDYWIFWVVNIHQGKDQEGNKRLLTNLLIHLLKNFHIYIYVV
jgi:hypothetical protein